MQLSRYPCAGQQAMASRRRVMVRATPTYAPPSSAPAASELTAMAEVSTIVPDALLLDSPVPLKAATVSNLVLKGIMSSSLLGMKPYQNAVTSSLTYGRCLQLQGGQRLSCQLDKAMANVGTMLADQVSGRVAQEIDPRLANDAGAMVAKAQFLLTLYQENGVSKDKLIFRIPGTWAGIQAARQLEQEGIATQVFMIFSYIQGVAAAQAGASVVQTNVGRTRDWYAKHPGVIRDPKGPREDSGFASRVDPGLQLVERVFNYVKQNHPKTQVMASGLRTKEDALALAGCDYLVMSSKIMQALDATPTIQGYNDGLTAPTDDLATRKLCPETAKAAPREQEPPVTADSFQSGLGHAGKELLEAGVQGLVKDVEAVLPYLSTMSVGKE